MSERWLASRAFEVRAMRPNVAAFPGLLKRLQDYPSRLPSSQRRIMLPCSS
jgi:hypothetical protein